MIVGACINFSGRINSMEGFSYNYFFSENRPLTEIISEQLDLSVRLENDTRAMTFGEYCEGVVDDERADDEQEYVDEHQDDDLVLGEAQDGPGHSAGHVFDGHDVPEQGRHGHQHDNTQNVEHHDRQRVLPPVHFSIAAARCA